MDFFFFFYHLKLGVLVLYKRTHTFLYMQVVLCALAALPAAYSTHKRVTGYSSMD